MLGQCVYYFIKGDLMYKIGEATNFNGRRGTYTSVGTKCKITEKIYNFLKNNPEYNDAEVYMIQAPTPQISYVDPLFPEEGAKYIVSSTKKAIEQKFAIAKFNVQKKAFDEEDKLNRAKFNREKALNMTNIVISTAAAVMKSIAANGGVPAGVPFGIASGALGAAQLAVVASSKYQGGSAPTMPSFAGGGVSTGGTGEQFAPTTRTQVTTATAGLLGGTNTTTSGQVFVLESDISQVQNNVMVAEQKSKF